MLTLKYNIVIGIYEKTQFSNVLVYIHIMKIPTNKGANSYNIKIWKRGDTTNVTSCCHKHDQIHSFCFLTTCRTQSKDMKGMSQKQVLYTNIDQTLVNSLHGLLNRK